MHQQLISVSEDGYYNGGKQKIINSFQEETFSHFLKLASSLLLIPILIPIVHDMMSQIIWLLKKRLRLQETGLLVFTWKTIKWLETSHKIYPVFWTSKQPLSNHPKYLPTTKH